MPRKRGRAQANANSARYPPNVGDKVMSELIYLGSILLSFAVLIVGALALWAVVEGAWWLFTKATGKEY
jgi:hypothetical protein